MKTKHIFYTNFKHDLTNKSDNNKNLVIENMFNVNTENNYIESELSIDELLNNLFNSEIVENIKLNNSTLLNSFSNIIPYEFFNEAISKTQTRTFCITNTNSLYELNNANLFFEEKYTFSTVPKIILSNSILYLFDSNNKCVVIEGNGVLSIENIPTIRAYSYFSNYLYFILEEIPNKIFITETCQLRNISPSINQYSFIQTQIEDGVIYSVENIRDKVYVFTQYSIFKIDESNNSLIKQNNINLKIYKESIKKLDDSIIFFSSIGLFLFDGNDIKQILNNNLNVLENANFVCFNHNLFILPYYNSKILYRYNFLNNTITTIKLDNILKLYAIKNFSVYNLYLCQSVNGVNKIITLYGNDKLNTNNQTVVFKTTFLDSDKLKQIKNIHIKCEGNFTLKITSNITSHCFNVSDSSSYFNLSLDGVYFDFEITSNSYFKLDSILLSYEEIGE